jgi:hypothetical protein
MDKILVNSVMVNLDTSVVRRILWISPDERYVCTIILFSNSFSPKLEFMSEIIYEIKSGKVEEIEDPYNSLSFIEENLTEKQKKFREKAWEVIKFIYMISPEPLIYESKSRGIAIKEAIDKFGLSRTTINKYISRYWQRGMTLNALIPDTTNCGAPGKERKAGKAKLGRKRKYSESEGVNVDDGIKRIFDKALNKYYYTAKQNSLKITYELMIRDYFTEFSPDGETTINIDSVPSVAQFRYYFNKNRDYKKEISTRHSSKEYYLNHRPILGDSLSKVQGGAGEVYQIDATIADFYLISECDKTKVVGRPTVYLVVDVFSRAIVGFHVTHEHPSYNAAMVALYNAFTGKKKEQFEQMGVNIDEKDFPYQHVCSKLISDRGELEGKMAEQIVRDLTTTLSLTPSFRGDLKAIVESFHAKINTYLKIFIPGFVDGGQFKRRGGTDYRLKARLTIKEARKIVAMTVLHINNNQFMKDYRLSIEMLEDNVLPIPINIWRWSIENRSGLLRKVDESTLKLALLPSGSGRITKYGLKFNGLYYKSERAMNDKWFEIARNDGSWNVEVKYDARNISTIFLVDDRNNLLDECKLLEHQNKYLNLSIEEVKEIQAYERKQYNDYKNDELESRINLYYDIEKVVKESQDTKFRNKVTKSSIKNLKDNRRLEKSIERKNETFEIEKNTEVYPTKCHAEEKVKNFIDEDEDLFIRIQKEMLDNE